MGLSHLQYTVHLLVQCRIWVTEQKYGNRKQREEQRSRHTQSWPSINDLRYQAIETGRLKSLKHFCMHIFYIFAYLTSPNSTIALFFGSAVLTHCSIHFLQWVNSELDHILILLQSQITPLRHFWTQREGSPLTILRWRTHQDTA